MKLYQSVPWAKSKRHASGCQVPWWAMFYAVSRTKELYHVPADHKVDVLGMQPRAWWSISRVLTINREKLLCRNVQTANWYLILNFLWYRYKKWICPYAQHEKKIKSSWLKIGKKCNFRACARRVHVPIIFILTTAFITHWYFVLQKNSYEISFKKKLHWKILKICSFSRFFENDWNTNRWLEKSEHKIIKIHEIRFFIMSYLTVLTSYHTM